MELTLEDDGIIFTRKSPEELQSEKDDLTIQNMFEEIKRLTLENSELPEDIRIIAEIRRSDRGMI